MSQSLKNIEAKIANQVFRQSIPLPFIFTGFFGNFSLKQLKRVSNLAETLRILQIVNLNDSGPLFAQKWSKKPIKVRGMNWSIAWFETPIPLTQIESNFKYIDFFD